MDAASPKDPHTNDPLPQRKVLHHDVPHWVTNHTLTEVFFITVCCVPRGHRHLTHADKWNDLLETIIYRNRNKSWTCHLVLAMPDHLHALITYDGPKSMKETMKDWKRWTTRTLGITWQDGFFDHRIRNQEELVEKRNYILDNPVRAGLIEATEKWPYLWQNR
jgi:putative transposase